MRMYEANATAAAHIEDIITGNVAGCQLIDAVMCNQLCLSSPLTNAFMLARCLIKIRIDRTALDEIIDNIVWWKSTNTQTIVLPSFKIIGHFSNLDT